MTRGRRLLTHLVSLTTAVVDKVFEGVQIWYCIGGAYPCGNWSGAKSVCLASLRFASWGRSDLNCTLDSCWTSVYSSGVTSGSAALARGGSELSCSDVLLDLNSVPNRVC